MIANALVNHLLSLSQQRLLGVLCLVAFGCGLLGAVVPWLLATLAEQTPRAKARRRRETNADAAATIQRLRAQCHELRASLDEAHRTNATLVGLVNEEANHNRNWDAQAHKVMRSAQ